MATTTGLGIHYSPHSLAYRQQDAELWIPEVQSLGLHWLALSGDITRAIPAPFLESILAAGIEPILFLNASEIRPLSETSRFILRTYQRAGVKLVSPYPAPNQKSSWPNSQWPAQSPVENFLDIFLPAAEMILGEGLIPVLPPMKPGGDYWDLNFLENFFRGAIQRGQDATMRKLVVATDLSAGNRPLDWGNGGATRWPDARPYLTPPGSQDSMGFQGYAWRDEIIRRTLGMSLPMIGTRAGACIGDQTDAAVPAVDAARHADVNLQVAQMAANGSFTSPMLCVLYWVLQSKGMEASNAASWYQSDGTVLPIVDNLKRRATAQNVSKTTPTRKTIRHYVLLPDNPISIHPAVWNQVRGYMQAFQASCGFSADEALHSEKVTVVGESVPSAVVLRLRDSGCFVDFLTPEKTG
jgi:hypothetical protein